MKLIRNWLEQEKIYKFIDTAIMTTIKKINILNRNLIINEKKKLLIEAIDEKIPHDVFEMIYRLITFKDKELFVFKYVYNKYRPDIWKRLTDELFESSEFYFYLGRYPLNIKNVMDWMKNYPSIKKEKLRIILYTANKFNKINELAFVLNKIYPFMKLGPIQRQFPEVSDNFIREIKALHSGSIKKIIKKTMKNNVLNYYLVDFDIKADIS